MADENPKSVVTKAVCERYDVWVGRSAWAVIMLDERGGVLSIQSDFGSYGHAWPSHGRQSFKHFLTELNDAHYLVGKLAPSREEFDGPGTIEGFRRAILEDEDLHEPNRNSALSMLDELSVADEAEFVDSLQRVSMLSLLFPVP